MQTRSSSQRKHTGRSDAADPPPPPHREPHLQKGAAPRKKRTLLMGSAHPPGDESSASHSMPSVKSGPKWREETTSKTGKKSTEKVVAGRSTLVNSYHSSSVPQKRQNQPMGSSPISTDDDGIDLETVDPLPEMSSTESSASPFNGGKGPRRGSPYRPAATASAAPAFASPPPVGLFCGPAGVCATSQSTKLQRSPQGSMWVVSDASTSPKLQKVVVFPPFQQVHWTPAEERAAVLSLGTPPSSALRLHNQSEFSLSTHASFKKRRLLNALGDGSGAAGVTLQPRDYSASDAQALQPDELDFYHHSRLPLPQHAYTCPSKDAAHDFSLIAASSSSDSSGASIPLVALRTVSARRRSNSAGSVATSLSDASRVGNAANSSIYGASIASPAASVSSGASRQFPGSVGDDVDSVYGDLAEGTIATRTLAVTPTSTVAQGNLVPREWHGQRRHAGVTVFLPGHGQVELVALHGAATSNIMSCSSLAAAEAEASFDSVTGAVSPSSGVRRQRAPAVFTSPQSHTTREGRARALATGSGIFRNMAADKTPIAAIGETAAETTNARTSEGPRATPPVFSEDSCSLGFQSPVFKRQRFGYCSDRGDGEMAAASSLTPLIFAPNELHPVTTKDCYELFASSPEPLSAEDRKKNASAYSMPPPPHRSPENPMGHRRVNNMRGIARSTPPPQQQKARSPQSSTPERSVEKPLVLLTPRRTRPRFGSRASDLWTSCSGSDSHAYSERVAEASLGESHQGSRRRSLTGYSSDSHSCNMSDVEFSPECSDAAYDGAEAALDSVVGALETTDLFLRADAEDLSRAGNFGSGCMEAWMMGELSAQSASLAGRSSTDCPDFESRISTMLSY
jgi:hypothetical protein